MRKIIKNVRFNVHPKRKTKPKKKPVNSCMFIPLDTIFELSATTSCSVSVFSIEHGIKAR